MSVGKGKEEVQICRLFRIGKAVTSFTVSVYIQNYVRVVEVWWDEYKDYFYASRPETLTLAYGDISELKRFRYNIHTTK